MGTLKRKNADGNWEYIQVSGLDVAQLRDDVANVQTSLTTKANQSDLNTTNASLAESTSNLNDRSINVLHPPVPMVAAKGDGSNESTLIQNIINSVSSNGGGRLFFPFKTFYVQGLTLPATNTIRLEGLGTLKLPNGATNHLLIIDTGGVRQFIEGITLDGNNANVTAVVDGIHFNDYTGQNWQTSATMDKIAVIGFKGNGIYAGLTRNGGQLKKSYVSSCGYGLRTSDSAGVADWIINDNQFGDSGYNIYGHFTAGMIKDNAIYRGTYANIKLLGQTWYSWVTGNSIDTSQQVGLVIEGDPTKDNMNIVSNNTFFGNSSSGDGLYSDITVKDINLTLISNNVFFKYPNEVNRTKYALELIASNNRAIIFSGNSLKASNFATGVISDTSKTFGYNYGLSQTVPEAMTWTANNTFKNYFTSSLASTGTLSQQIFLSGKAKANWQLYGDGKQIWGDGTNNQDTNLYRSGAGLLKTDTKLIAGTGLGVGNSAAATTLGTVTKKMEVFDANGTSLGFVPIYNSIT